MKDMFDAAVSRTGDSLRFLGSRMLTASPFSFAVKLQYRDIDTFIHPDYRERFDLKFVKRFSETRLSWDEYETIKDAIEEAGRLRL